MKTPQDLLQPRYKVIAGYPGSPFSVGDTITFDGVVYGTGEPQKFERNPQEYPALFRPMPWWEDRTVEDMPGYLLNIPTGKIRVVSNYLLDLGLVSVLHSEGSTYPVKLDFMMPATLEEFTEQKEAQGE